MNLTPDEIERYAPYHTMPEFSIGYEEYMAGTSQINGGDPDGVGGQAYDRGAECAMRREHRRITEAWKVGCATDHDVDKAKANLCRIAFKSAGATRKR